MRSNAICLLSGLFLSAGALCAQPVFAAPVGAVQDATVYTESGEATWYGPRHEGQRTTSGERFDSSKMTAAHSSLPMGSFVRVTMEQTGRSIVVRVNDREPPHGVRCIDLSRAAAARLGFLGRGVASVTLAQISREEATEVAEAPEDAVADDAGSAPPRANARHGRRHTRHARR
jgi:rare lipoprotein A (peptidoglycan hydrolase)